MKAQTEVIRELVDVCTRAAAGDLEARICRSPEDAELAALANAINRLLDISDAYVRESAAAMEHCARGQYHRPILQRGLNGSYRNAARTINDAALKMRGDSDMISRFAVERAAVAHRVSLTTASVTQSSEHMLSSAGTIRDHVGSTRQLAAEVAAATDEAAQNVNAVAAACHELTACTGEITRRTGESATVTREAVNESSRAHQAVTHLGDAARQIGSVVDVISKIARQTNLLALNATIEAARAGEHGRSFAVVAAEVKNLSRETAQATDKITAQIEAMQTATTTVATVIGGVGESINRIDATAAAIATAVGEQAKATEEIARRISEVSGATATISGRMGALVQASESLATVTDGMKAAAEALANDAASLQRETAALDSSSTSGAPPEAKAA
jgi:methyl-accepting chemotaxis protein